MKVTRKEFVRVWQSSKNRQEVAKKLGLGESYVTTKASGLRTKYGIRLKKFQRGPKYKKII